MKFKHLFLTVSVMALFSSCSNDELVSETTSHGDAIAFSVTTNNATRAADYWCNNNLPKYFEVSAVYDGATYFHGDIFTNNGSGKQYVQFDGVERFWPAVSATTPLNVYAYKVKADGASAIGDSFIDGVISWPDDWSAEGAAPKITMTPATKAAEQHDLLYAYTQVKAKPAYGAQAPINFRHALSQIVFYAKCENKKIHVEIEEIALMNAAESGTFTLPVGANVTDGNLFNHSQAGTEPSTGLGTWALNYNASNANRTYTASCTKEVDSKTVLTALTPGAATWTNLTDQIKADGSYDESEYGESLLVLPHGKNTSNANNKKDKYVPWKNVTTGEGGEETTTKTYQPLSTVGGACIAIKCKIRNISGAAVTDDDVYLWGDKQTDGTYKAKDLVVPVDFTWEQGKKYIYRINFSKLGHGGYNPEDGHEVLVPIQLTVTVDDFAKVTDIEKTADGDDNL